MPSSSTKDFEYLASPPSWYEVAKLLNEQATALHESRSSIIRFTSHDGTTTVRSTHNRGTFLLAGFSLENLIKAYLIYEFPHYISNGRLANQLKTHKLSKLWQASSFVPYKTRFMPTIFALENGLESWARYPCAISHEVTVFELSMTDELWDAYCKLFSFASKKLERLLTKGWLNDSGERSRMEYR